MKKFVSFLLLCTMVFTLAACGQSDSGTSTPGGDLPSLSLPSSSAAEPEDTQLEVAYLTGQQKGADYPEGKRIAAVMVGNTPTARPAYGLSEAKILIEIDANAGITRFLAMYEDYEKVPKVGSVRSARDPFVQLLIPTYGFFVHQGPSENQPARLMLDQYDYYGNYDLDGVNWSQKDRDNKVFNWFNTDGETIAGAVSQKGYDDRRTYNSPFFSFVPYTEPARTPAEGDANEVTVVLTPSFRTSFDFDSAAGTYKMSQFNSYTGAVEPTVDANNNEQLAFNNVLVLFAPMSIYPGTGSEQLNRVEFGSGGGGFLISNGGYERLIWRKGAPDQPLRLENIDGSEVPVELNPGTTYIAVVDEGRSDDFYAQLTSGTADEHAQGEVNTGLVDED